MWERDGVSGRKLEYAGARRFECERDMEYLGARWCEVEGNGIFGSEMV